MEREAQPELVAALHEALAAEGIGDAVILRKVVRMRELLQVFDRELFEIQRLVAGSAEAEVPPDMSPASPATPAS